MQLHGDGEWWGDFVVFDNLPGLPRAPEEFMTNLLARGWKSVHPDFDWDYMFVKRLRRVPLAMRRPNGRPWRRVLARFRRY